MDTNALDKKNKNSVGYLLQQLITSLQRTMKLELDRLEITHTQFIILATLFRLSPLKENITQMDIATESQTDKMMVSKVLRALQVKKMVTRQEHATDTRAKTIKLTPFGIQVFFGAFKVVKKVESDFFKPLGRNKPQFTDQLRIIIKGNKK